MRGQNAESSLDSLRNSWKYPPFKIADKNFANDFILAKIISQSTCIDTLARILDHVSFRSLVFLVCVHVYVYIYGCNSGSMSERLMQQNVHVRYYTWVRVLKSYGTETIWVLTGTDSIESRDSAALVCSATYDSKSWWAAMYASSIDHWDY